MPGKPAPPRTPRVQSNPSMLQPGAMLGQRYEILQILGEGGMGAVYKARDRELNRMVALKVIRPDLAGSQAIIDRFKQELLLATQVTHKNVIRIYDLSEADGMKFITMEYVEGEDLRGLMQQKGKLAPEEAVEIMLQICRALEAAHSAGIIHRDLKPQNIMRDKSGRILVMDFGLARCFCSSSQTDSIRPGSRSVEPRPHFLVPQQVVVDVLDRAKFMRPVFAGHHDFRVRAVEGIEEEIDIFEAVDPSAKAQDIIGRGQQEGDRRSDFSGNIRTYLRKRS